MKITSLFRRPEPELNLHIGGIEARPDWKILNVQAGPDVDYVGDIADLSQFADRSIRRIYASHVLEHVPQARQAATLKGLHRVLADGGELMISVPDMDILCHLFINPQASGDMKFHAMRMIFGGQIDANDYHYFGWNYGFLHQFLREAGFQSIERVGDFGLFEDTSAYKPYGFPISLNVIARK